MYFIPIKSNFTEKRGAPFPMYPTPQMVLDIGAFIPSQNFSQNFSQFFYFFFWVVFMYGYVVYFGVKMQFFHVKF